MNTVQASQIQKENPKWHVCRADFQAESGRDDWCIVWLHGWGQSGASMLRLADQFKDFGDQLVFDLPGFGASEKLGDAAGTEDYADSLAKELERQNLMDKKLVLVGHSFGGRVAVQYASKYGKGLCAIVLIAAAGLPRRRSLGWHIRARILKGIGILSKLSDRLFGTRYHAAYRLRFGSSDYRNAGALRGTFVRTVNENLTRQAQSCRCPALMVYGDRDTETPAEIGRRFEQLVPISRLEILKGFGHLDILDRGVYQVTAHINDFLAKLAR